MNTLEGNKIIADFMGAVDGFIHYTGQGEDMVYSIQETKYHTSWDWLMPVVEKIESLGYKTSIENNFCSIDNQEMYFETKEFNPQKLEATYKVIFEFIQWYNTQQ